MLDVSAVRFVYFDLDDTLLDHRAAEREALADCCSTFATHFDGHALAHVQETYHAHNVPLWRRYAAGEIGRDDVQRLRFERLHAALELDGLDAAHLGETYLDRYAAHWRWTDGAGAAFHAVADRFPVGLLTNGFADVQHAKLDRFPVLRERSDAVVISEEVGVMKPHPAIFAHAADVAGVEPGAILYIGDSLHSDVEGGRGAGWQVAWYGGDPARSEAFVFAEWTALVDALLG
ncbi:MAG: HAD family hydrolase [Rhodothermales bacterium]